MVEEIKSKFQDIINDVNQKQETKIEGKIDDKAQDINNEVNQKQETKIEKIKGNIDLIFEHNQLTQEYDKLILQKDKILKQNNHHELILRSNQNLQKKIKFYNKKIKNLHLATVITHIILAVIIIIALIYHKMA